MREEIARINVSIAEADRRIAVGIGIATGEVMVGVFGSPWKKEYTAFGAPVNLATRLEHGARADQILVCGDTARRVEDFVHLEKMDSAGDPRICEVSRGVQRPREKIGNTTLTICITWITSLDSSSR